MKPSNTTGGTIFWKYTSSSWNGYNISYWLNNGTEWVWEFAYRAAFHAGIYQTYDNPNYWLVEDTIPDGNWHHYVFIVDSLNGKIYKDGEQIGNYTWWFGSDSPITTPQATTAPDNLKFGGGYTGHLDDIGIWNRALSEVEIAELYAGGIGFCDPSIRIFPDYNQNCSLDQGEYSSYISQIPLVIEPEEIYVLTDNVGEVYLCGLNLADGPHQVSISTDNSPWTTECPETIDFNVQNGIIQSMPEFGLYSTSPCPQPDVSIFCPTIRRCSEHSWPIYVNACNLPSGTDVIQEAYVDVVLDSFIYIESATLPYQDLGQFVYRFDIGDLNPGQCNNFVINVNFGCEFELGETVCMEARMFPVQECELDDEGEFEEDEDCPSWEWDNSRIDVEGWCSGDSVYFDVKNIGSGNMDCFRQVNLFVDYGLQETDSVKLNAGAQRTLRYPCSGETYILKANQHPFHPGNSHPTDFVENCGGTNWTPGVVNCYPHDDVDPVVDIFCGTVVGSFDPNDKTGYPLGFGPQHDILPGQQLNYVIRFQNTGTAEAYNIVVRDTVDSDVDILSLVMGPVSHNYTFQIDSGRVLKWTFANIMLPDSTTNEEESHGFITYTINQSDMHPNGTTITNSAAIYFDSNDPIITNTTLHTINDQLDILAGEQQLNDSNSKTTILQAFPNPFENTITVVKNTNDACPFEITDITGRVVKTGVLVNDQTLLSMENIPSGVYLMRALTIANNSIKIIKH
jgi:uncharacterized repeat protein (TIGR01451 family)